MIRLWGCCQRFQAVPLSMKSVRSIELMKTRSTRIIVNMQAWNRMAFLGLKTFRQGIKRYRRVSPNKCCWLKQVRIYHENSVMASNRRLGACSWCPSVFLNGKSVRSSASSGAVFIRHFTTKVIAVWRKPFWRSGDPIRDLGCCFLIGQSLFMNSCPANIPCVKGATLRHSQVL